MLNFKATYNYLKENRGHDAEMQVSSNNALQHQVISCALDLFGMNVSPADYSFEHLDLGERLNLDLEDPEVWSSGLDRAVLYADYVIHLKKENRPLYISIKANDSNTSHVSASIKRKQELLYELIKFDSAIASKQFKDWLELEDWDPDMAQIFMDAMKFNEDEVINATRGLMFNKSPYVVITIDPEEGTIIEDSSYLVNEETLGELSLEDPRFFYSPTYDKPISECTVSVVSGGRAFSKIDFRIRFKVSKDGSTELRIQLDSKL